VELVKSSRVSRKFTSFRIIPWLRMCFYLREALLMYIRCMIWIIL